ncbi:MAG: MBL fold metallo-hydrolase [Thermoanaerobaculia bacterium]
MRSSARIGSRLACLVGILVGIAIFGIAARGALAALLAAPPPSPAPAEPPLALVLGVAQDGGVPHAGCHQRLCEEARRDPSKRRLVASLGLLDPAAGKRFLIDATPDFAGQIELLGGLPDAILLTHAHIGHYLGLAQLGREVLGARRMPVYATPSMARFLRENSPWKRLVLLENIELRELAPGATVNLTPSLSVTAIPVPHRDEDSDTVAFLVTAPRRKLLWLPDIDKWEKWDRRIEEMLRDPALVAFVDGTFFSADEIPGRSIAEIPHPLVSETMDCFGTDPPRGRLFFVHLNHTNRLLWDRSAIRQVEAKGFRIAKEGMRLPL